MTDYTEGGWGTCPHCKRRFWLDDGPECDCMEVAHKAELDELRDSLSKDDLWDALFFLYEWATVCRKSAYANEIGANVMCRLLSQWEDEFPDVVKMLEK